MNKYRVTHPQKVVQAEEGESILKVDAKVYILRRVNNNVDELNTGHLEGEGKVKVEELIPLNERID